MSDTRFRNAARHVRLLALLACMAMTPLGARAASGDATIGLQAVLDEYDKYLSAADPIGAGQRGDLAAARLWPDDSPAAVAARTATLRALGSRLQAIPAAELQGQDALNRDLLGRRIAIDVEGATFDEERVPFTSDEGFYAVPGYAAESIRLRSRAEADAFLARLAALPAYYATAIDNMRRGLRTGFVQPRITALAAAHATRLMADKPPEASGLLAPFESLSALPADDRAALKRQALNVVTDTVKPAERRLADFFEHEYLPKARTTIGASAMPGGRAYYAYRARRETTTSMTPEQISALGVAEIARIRAAMDVVIAETSFHGTFKAFQAFLRTDPQFYATSRDDLLDKASRLAKRVDDKLPGYFHTLPRLPYGVRNVPADIEDGYTSGRYNPGSPHQGVAGGLMINTSHLDQRPLYELPALVAHEGAPGHHIQIALAQEQGDGVPQFRKQDDLTAFVEGWALYAEQLVDEFRLYETPYQRFGMLSMEMWRACRLVVDVGIHWSGMSRDDAVACLRDNSALAEKNIQNEVDRYIAWPGQALGYKVGELKILELRRRAQAALGSAFDVRRFHDLVLDDGPMPMDLLEIRVDAWIAEQRATMATSATTPAEKTP